MRSKKARKWMASALLLALAMTAIIPATGAAPPAQAPDSVACGDAITCSTAGNAVYIRNSGPGPALYGQNTSTGEGLKGKGNPGVYGFSYFAAGVRGKSNQGVGVKGESVDKYGVQGISETGTGIYGVSTNGPTGVYGESSSYSGQGVYGRGFNFLTEGVLGTSELNVGVYGISGGTEGNNIGVWGQTAGTWGFYSNQSILVNGCTGCTLSFVGRNANGSPLQVGDLVSASGVESPLEGQQTPILRVRRATAGSAVLGIVLARAEVSTAQARVSTADPDMRKAVKVAGMAEGPVAPDDYLFIVVQGLVQVRADPGSGIQAGDRLMAGSDGLAALSTPDAQTIGQAVDSADPASGLVWVLVDLQ